MARKKKEKAAEPVFVHPPFPPRYEEEERFNLKLSEIRTALAGKLEELKLGTFACRKKNAATFVDENGVETKEIIWSRPDDVAPDPTMERKESVEALAGFWEGMLAAYVDSLSEGGDEQKAAWIATDLQPDPFEEIRVASLWEKHQIVDRPKTRAALFAVAMARSPIPLVWCPASEFLIGSDDSVPEKDRKTQITKSYFTSAFQTTQAQWRKIMGNNPSYFCKDHSEGQSRVRDPNRPGEYLNTDDFPVERVTWVEAVEYCQKLTILGRKEGWLSPGQYFHLPTEAQWECAYRAGTTTKTPWGNSLSSHQANFNGNYPFGDAPKGPYLERTTSVGSYPPNPWGIYDILGNVYEFCASSYTDKPLAGQDPCMKDLDVFRPDGDKKALEEWRKGVLPIDFFQFSFTTTNGNGSTPTNLTMSCSSTSRRIGDGPAAPATSGAEESTILTTPGRIMDSESAWGIPDPLPQRSGNTISESVGITNSKNINNAELPSSVGGESRSVLGSISEEFSPLQRVGGPTEASLSKDRATEPIATTNSSITDAGNIRWIDGLKTDSASMSGGFDPLDSGNTTVSQGEAVGFPITSVGEDERNSGQEILGKTAVCESVLEEFDPLSSGISTSSSNAAQAGLLVKSKPSAEIVISPELNTGATASASSLVAQRDFFNSTEDTRRIADAALATDATIPIPQSGERGQSLAVSSAVHSTASASFSPDSLDFLEEIGSGSSKSEKPTLQHGETDDLGLVAPLSPPLEASPQPLAFGSPLEESNADPLRGVSENGVGITGLTSETREGESEDCIVGMKTASESSSLDFVDPKPSNNNSPCEDGPTTSTTGLGENRECTSTNSKKSLSPDSGFSSPEAKSFPLASRESGSISSESIGDGRGSTNKKLILSEGDSPNIAAIKPLDSESFSAETRLPLDGTASSEEPRTTLAELPLSPKNQKSLTTSVIYPIPSESISAESNVSLSSEGTDTQAGISIADSHGDRQLTQFGSDTTTDKDSPIDSEASGLVSAEAKMRFFDPDGKEREPKWIAELVIGESTQPKSADAVLHQEEAPSPDSGFALEAEQPFFDGSRPLATKSSSTKGIASSTDSIPKIAGGKPEQGVCHGNADSGSVSAESKPLFFEPHGMESGKESPSDSVFSPHGRKTNAPECLVTDESTSLDSESALKEAKPLFSGIPGLPLAELNWTGDSDANTTGASGAIGDLSASPDNANPEGSVSAFPEEYQRNFFVGLTGDGIGQDLAISDQPTLDSSHQSSLTMKDSELASLPTQANPNRCPCPPASASVGSSSKTIERSITDPTISDTFSAEIRDPFFCRKDGRNTSCESQEGVLTVFDHSAKIIDYGAASTQSLNMNDTKASGFTSHREVDEPFFSISQDIQDGIPFAEESIIGREDSGESCLNIGILATPSETNATMTVIPSAFVSAENDSRFLAQSGNNAKTPALSIAEHVSTSGGAEEWIKGEESLTASPITTMSDFESVSAIRPFPLSSGGSVGPTIPASTQKTPDQDESDDSALMVSQQPDSEFDSQGLERFRDEDPFFSGDHGSQTSSPLDSNDGIKIGLSSIQPNGMDCEFISPEDNQNPFSAADTTISIATSGGCSAASESISTISDTTIQATDSESTFPEIDRHFFEENTKSNADGPITLAESESNGGSTRISGMNPTWDSGSFSPVPERESDRPLGKSSEMVIGPTTEDANSTGDSFGPIGMTSISDSGFTFPEAPDKLPLPLCLAGTTAGISPISPIPDGQESTRSFHTSTREHPYESGSEFTLEEVSETESPKSDSPQLFDTSNKPIGETLSGDLFSSDRARGNISVKNDDGATNKSISANSPKDCESVYRESDPLFFRDAECSSTGTFGSSESDAIVGTTTLNSSVIIGWDLSSQESTTAALGFLSPEHEEPECEVFAFLVPELSETVPFASATPVGTVPKGENMESHSSGPEGAPCIGTAAQSLVSESSFREPDSIPFELSGDSACKTGGLKARSVSTQKFSTLVAPTVFVSAYPEVKEGENNPFCLTGESAIGLANPTIPEWISDGGSIKQPQASTSSDLEFASPEDEWRIPFEPSGDALTSAGLDGTISSVSNNPLKAKGKDLGFASQETNPDPFGSGADIDITRLGGNPNFVSVQATAPPSKAKDFASPLVERDPRPLSSGDKINSMIMVPVDSELRVDWSLSFGPDPVFGFVLEDVEKIDPLPCGGCTAIPASASPTLNSGFEFGVATAIPSTSSPDSGLIFPETESKRRPFSEQLGLEFPFELPKKEGSIISMNPITLGTMTYSGFEFA